jgi:hypothetical protein
MVDAAWFPLAISCDGASRRGLAHEVDENSLTNLPVVQWRELSNLRKTGTINSARPLLTSRVG